MTVLYETDGAGRARHDRPAGRRQRRRPPHRRGARRRVPALRRRRRSRRRRAHGRERQVLRRRGPQGDAGAGAPRASRVEPDGDGPVGPTRMLLAKPVIAAVEGHAVAGGLELAAWCDLRVAAEDAVFGVYCRRWGIPLMDGGTIRLAAADRPQPRARPDPHRPRRQRRGGAAHGPRQPAGRRRARRSRRRPRSPTRWRRARRPPCAATGSRPTSSGRCRSTRRWPASTATAWPRSRPASSSGDSIATPPATGAGRERLSKPFGSATQPAPGIIRQPAPQGPPARAAPRGAAATRSEA